MVQKWSGWIAEAEGRVPNTRVECVRFAHRTGKPSLRSGMPAAQPGCRPRERDCEIKLLSTMG